MGARKKHAPRRGSLAYTPRKRARREVPRIRYWPDVEGPPRLLGFAGYKAGMTHVIMIEDRERAPNAGKEIAVPATIVETPPLVIIAVRAYERTPYGLKTLTEVWMDPRLYDEEIKRGEEQVRELRRAKREASKEEAAEIENKIKALEAEVETARKLKNFFSDLERATCLPEEPKTEERLRELEANLDRVAEIRVLAATQPRLVSGVPKKKPDIMEIKIGGGTIREQFEYAKQILGREVPITDVFREGQLVDVVAVTKGKGWAGVVKRWGVKILPRKTRKGRRRVGALGPWHPARVLYTVPRPGQLGYHQRTEFNKRILKIGFNGEEVTPKGGFLRYGVVRNAYVLLKGSIPGPAKRLIRLRYPARPNPRIPQTPPKILYVSLESPQGK
ncbi:50S ribosomal protein L3 [Candidatus Bathyarchaeota archaeon]|nr:MAG: 50S ribosomal protein L3 [Candidatus Bathyarchaeota archaeon]